ncbi:MULTISPECIES: type I-E CRISPR-associated endoribonuclease Cas2e [unclassified Azospirillum]|uniref:type I-E CRISPR-associated endoribonuclease Cas2e n=1 Tax=unclassified Azospirillum TaxID=2630922 RepID=UPI000B75F46E|nr:MULTISPECIES: type I-E CRISPR-associated endoribonuclease Cas2e [unclassified Azospirillum]SNT19531.1 CRISPR-associated protein, Cas2 family [Azospirillum sp. RU38E]SNT31348.1 CRISPR-associated protein, Cas2 family [Azospirillum sp. RU37A]
MIVICLSATADRFHGFLRSAMLNVHPGVYIAMDLDAGSRDRIWGILESWWYADPRGQAVMIYRDKSKPMEIDFRCLGSPKRDIIDYDGHYALVEKAKTGESG